LCDSTLAGVSTTINLNSGDDTMWMANGSGNVAALAGAVTVNGGGDVDNLVLFDSASTDGDDTTINSSSVIQPGMALLSWGNGVENLYIDGAQGNNNFFLDSSNASTQVSVKGGGGNDVMFISNVTHNLASTGAAIFDGQAGANSLLVIDDGPSLGSTYDVTA